MNEIIAYITEFLLYGQHELLPLVGYTADRRLWQQYKAVIIPNNHLGKELVVPDWSLPVMHTEGNTIVFDTDIIYNSFFFISRAEELINKRRDEHGRFSAVFSFIGQNSQLETPLVDIYSIALLQALGSEVPSAYKHKICLTHDVDTIEHYRHIRGGLGGLMRGEWNKVIASWRHLSNDPAYTFDWLIEQDKLCARQNNGCQTIYFIKDTKGKGFDYPQYNLCKKDYLKTENLLIESGAQLGLHSSYYGQLPEHTSYKLHRAHYLNCSIPQMRRLIDIGITDDYTMGFADKVGFRLQTCRPVRWIDPESYELTNLTLHPLSLMDVTLSNFNYMNLDIDQAFEVSCHVIDTIRKYKGEIVLLWHNSNINSTTYHQTLYPRILQYI